ncbi:hypothetical protein [Paraburkholderia xenovorans]|uniref:hypothetical protein n=1 Tax=Paraburkholderia xenovorans TaxID=36873 RepID=UPI0038B82A91
MSTRHDKDNEFEISLPAASTTEWTSPVPDADAETMRGLHLASASVLCLATQTYDAAARGDAAGAEAARASLEQQLALATRLIDELLFDGSGPHTTH